MNANRAGMLWSPPFEKANIGDQKRIYSRPGKIYRNQIFVSEQVVRSIVYINKLSLPDELIDIIKDYVYYTSDFIWYRHNLNFVLSDFNQITIKRSVMVGNDDNEEWEWNIKIREEDSSENTCDFLICAKCGEYSSDRFYTEEYKNMVCQCTDHIVYQIQDNIQTFNAFDIHDDKCTSCFNGDRTVYFTNDDSDVICRECM